jgi:peptidoglycan/xylan/chitin deacetylase (PgdA/CDA1 family)
MRQVSLSFDNGPDPHITPQVLDILAKHRVKASFFVVGQKLSTPAGRKLAERTSAEGHWLGNHTFTHSSPLGLLDREAAIEEFVKTERALEWVDQEPRLFRPYGRQGKLGKHLMHAAVVEKLKEGGYSCVLWNAVPGDWKDPDGWVARGLGQIEQRDWSLVVLHDHLKGVLNGLDGFIGKLLDSGTTIVQDYPPDCVPIRAGVALLPTEPWTTP